MRKLGMRTVIAAACMQFFFLGTPQGLTYCIGADLSFLKQQEDGGIRFKDSGVVKPGLQIFRQHGYNWIRLRIFYAPTTLPNNPTYTIALAQQAKALGFSFLLDFHYSDTWADPGTQGIPAAWNGLSHSVLVDSVYQYTRAVISAFRAAGVLPDMVQIGNEITNGILWPDGSTSNWNNLADLLKAGVRGVDSGKGSGAMPSIMLHISDGGDSSATQTFFDNADSHGVPFDIIGQSYYPYWQGTLTALQNNLAFTANRYHKDIIVVETAFYDSAAPHLALTPFPQDTAGQAQYLRAVDSIVRTTPNGHGKGLFWWEPTYFIAPATRYFFDEQSYAAKPVIRVFDQYNTSISLPSRKNPESAGIRSVLPILLLDANGRILKTDRTGAWSGFVWEKNRF